MSGSRTKVQSKRITIPSVYIETEVDVELTEADLAEYGYVPRDGGEGVISAVERWHVENHPGVFLWCLAQPCEDVVKASGK